MGWWAESGSLALGRDGRVYSASHRGRYVGHTEGAPTVDLTDQQWLDWEWLAAEWRESVAEDVEAEDWRQYRLGLMK